MSDKSNASSGGIGLVGMLGILFVGLKLGNVIDWSWWWVTAPFWGGVALAVSLVAVVLVCALIVEFMKALTGGR